MPVRLLLLLMPLVCAGCFGTSQSTDGGTAAVTWVEKDLPHADLSISLGRRENHPVAGISRSGKPAADVMVFCTPIDEADAAAVEVATVYDAAASSNLGLYVAEDIEMVSDGGSNPIRFRVVTGEGEAWTRDVKLSGDQ